MKKNNAMKKLMSATAMLGVSAAMLATSTYAWFSLNDTVTVNGMSVSVTSDSTFLLVMQGSTTASAVQTNNAITAIGANSTATLYPTAHHLTPGTGVTIDDIEEEDSSVNTKYDTWYYRYSRSASGATVNMTDEEKVVIANKDNYLLVNDFSLAVNQNSQALSGLKVGTCTITPDASGAEAIKVLVATDEACEEFSGTGGSGSVTLRSTNLGGTDVEHVRVYVYWDGNDSDVYTNNIANLKDTEVQITFTGTAVPGINP